MSLVNLSIPFVNLSILDKHENYDYNRYFRIGHVNSIIFVQGFCTSSFAFTSGLFRENMEQNLFRVSRNSKMRKKNPFALPYHLP